MVSNCLLTHQAEVLLKPVLPDVYTLGTPYKHSQTCMHMAPHTSTPRPCRPLLEECASKVTDLGCASAVVRLLKSLDDLTPVVDSVEAALLKETELREMRIDWEVLQRTYCMATWG